MIVDQIILGAVQEGMCAKPNEVNPYSPSDKKQFMGWEQGHKTAIKDYQQREKYANLSWFCKLKCLIGRHRYHLTKIPGRPHIDPKTRSIDRRDPIIEQYVCVYCDKTYFINLDGGPEERKRRQVRFAKQMGYDKRRRRP